MVPIIPLIELKKWKIFQGVPLNPEDAAILNEVKSAHITSSGGKSSTTATAYIVTRDDNVYLVERLSKELGQFPQFKLTLVSGLCQMKVTDFLVLDKATDHVALTNDGTLYARLPPSLKIDKLRGLDGVIFVQVVQSSDGDVALGVTQEGQVYGWGRSHFGQMATEVSCGLGMRSQSALITKALFNNEKIIQAATSLRGSFAITETNKLFFWGSYFRVGRHTSTPQLVFNPGDVKIRKIVGARYLLAALDLDGRIYCFSPESSVKHKAAVQDLVALDIKADTESDFFACYTQDKKVYVWGVGEKLPSEPKLTPFATINDAFAAYKKAATLRAISFVSNEKIREGNGVVGAAVEQMWTHKDEDSCDVKFLVTGEVVVGAHKFVLTMRSNHFRQMFDGNCGQAGDDGCIHIADTDFTVFDALLFFLYTNKVKFPCSEMQQIFKLRKLAESYGESVLQKMCEDELVSALTVDNALQMLQKSVDFKAEDLEKHILQYILTNRAKVGEKLSNPELLNFLDIRTMEKLTFALLR